MLNGSPPIMIDWPLTSRCNLQCRHCRGFPAGELPTERARQLIGEIAALKPGWVIAEGGEPLLRSDIFELLGLMRENRLDVHLISNGMLLNESMIGSLKQLGVNLMISMDGATKSAYEAIRTGASFDIVTGAVRNAARAGILEAINFTVLKQNFTEIPGMFQMAASLGVPRITLIGLKPCADYAQKLMSPAEYRAAIALTCEASQKTGIEFFFDEPFFWASVKHFGLPANMPAKETGILSSNTSSCIFGEYLFIEVNGDVKPCSFSPMVVGNIYQKSLGEIWREVSTSPFFDKVRDNQTRTGACRQCRYLPECKGCRSRTFSLTGDWFTTDPCCPVCH